MIYFNFILFNIEIKNEINIYTITMSYLDLCDSQWNGRVLFISIHPEYSDLEDVYKNAISNHNKKIKKTYPDSGFDLFIPKEILDNSQKIEKVNFGIKTAMFSNIFVEPNTNEFSGSKAEPFYLYARSSISKTRVRLANNVGIIDSGYRGNICAYFDIKKTSINDDLISEKDNAVIILSKYQRVLQICSNTLEPFKVILINDIESLGETERGDGGFGSTGV